MRESDFISRELIAAPLSPDPGARVTASVVDAPGGAEVPARIVAMKHVLTRRGFLAAAGAGLGAGAGRAIRLGGPVFLKSGDPAELAREHRRLGYSAAYCPRAKAEDTARTREIERAFAAENVVIAEVGAWVNLLDPDEEKRRANSVSYTHLTLPTKRIV